LTLRRFAGARGDHYFVIRILNIGLQITRLPMHQWMAALIDFFALVKGFAIWHARYLRHYDATFHPLRPRAGVSQMPTSSEISAEVSALRGSPTELAARLRSCFDRKERGKGRIFGDASIGG
jgi:hypothetical protein